MPWCGQAPPFRAGKDHAGVVAVLVGAVFGAVSSTVEYFLNVNDSRLCFSSCRWVSAGPSLNSQTRLPFHRGVLLGRPPVCVHHTGRQPRVTRRPTLPSTYAAAFLQLYREEGHYRERSSAWIERVGLPYVKERIVEDAPGRTLLYERFMESQKYAQINPWEAPVQNAEARRKYTPLMEIAAAAE